MSPEQALSQLETLEFTAAVNIASSYRLAKLIIENSKPFTEALEVFTDPPAPVRRKLLLRLGHLVYLDQGDPQYGNENDVAILAMLLLAERVWPDKPFAQVLYSLPSEILDRLWWTKFYIVNLKTDDHSVV